MKTRSCNFKWVEWIVFSRGGLHSPCPVYKSPQSLAALQPSKEVFTGFIESIQIVRNRCLYTATLTDTDNVIPRGYEITNSIVVQSTLANFLSVNQLSLVYTPDGSVGKISAGIPCSWKYCLVWFQSSARFPLQVSPPHVAGECWWEWFGAARTQLSTGGKRGLAKWAISCCLQWRLVISITKCASEVEDILYMLSVLKCCLICALDLSVVYLTDQEQLSTTVQAGQML